MSGTEVRKSMLSPVVLIGCVRLLSREGLLMEGLLSYASDLKGRSIPIPQSTPKSVDVFGGGMYQRLPYIGIVLGPVRYHPNFEGQISVSQRTRGRYAVVSAALV